MNHLFVKYPIAKMAKDSGFYEKCLANIDSNNQLHFLNPSDKDSFEFDQQIAKYNGVPAVNCPLYDQLVEWFLSQHNIWIEIYFNHSGCGYILTKGNGTTIKEIEDSIFFKDQYSAYDKAFEESFKLIDKK